MPGQENIRVKIVLIGEGAVGKTSIAKRYLGQGYTEKYVRTVGADFYIQKREYNDPDLGEVSLQWLIWDLGGQPTFEEVRPMYYRGAKAALLVYDITRAETYYSLPNWINEFWRHSGGSYPVVLVANKIDLRGEEVEEVPKDVGKKYSKTLSEYTGFDVPFVETSAEEDRNIDKAFEALAHLILVWAKQSSKSNS